MNDRGDVAYFGVLDPFDFAILLRRGATTQAILRDFQDVPEIGTFVLELPEFRAFNPDYSLNDRGEMALVPLVFDEFVSEGVVRAAVIWEGGRFRLLARPGTEVPGVGTIERIHHGVLLNNRGQVLLQVELTDGRRMLLRTR